MGSFELPPRCQTFCPLNRANINEYPLVVSRNCTGPQSSTGPATSKVSVDKEGNAREIALNEEAAAFGRFVCVNAAVNESLKALLEMSSANGADNPQREQ
jgi:hypothetical protein